MTNTIIHPSKGYTATTDRTGQLLEGVRSYVAAFSTPALPIEQVYPADVNFVTLPAGTNDYAVYSIIDQENVGTPVHQPTPDGEAVGVYVRSRVQIDLYSTADAEGYDNARTRALALSMLARTATGVGFFDRYGVDCLFSDYSQNSPYQTDSNLYASRWTVTLNLGFWHWVSVNRDYFQNIKTNVRNVDVHFHP